MNRINSYAASTPSVDADGVYALWPTADKTLLMAFNHKGKEIWKRTFPGVPIPSKQAPEPWSTTETTGLIGTIIAALGASGLGGKKLLDKRRRDRDEKEEAKASAAEAQSLAAALREKLDAEEFEDMMRENKCLKARLDKADYEKKANGNA